MFRLCPHGERIKLCGRAAVWHGGLVGHVIMSIPRPVVPRICAAPVTPKEAPGLATVSSSGSLFSLGSEAALQSPHDPMSGSPQRKDSSKTYILSGYRFVLGSKPPYPAITLGYMLGFFCVHKFRATVTEPGRLAG